VKYSGLPSVATASDYYRYPISSSVVCSKWLLTTVDDRIMQYSRAKKAQSALTIALKDTYNTFAHMVQRQL